MAKVSGSSSQTFGPSLSVDEGTEVSTEAGNGKSRTLPSQLRTSSSGSTLHSLSSVSIRPNSGIHELSPVLAMIVGKMEPIVRDMQHASQGVRMRGKAHLGKSKTPASPSFSGADLVTWLMGYLDMHSRAEASNLASLLCQFGYLFSMDHSVPCCTVRDDSTLYRFQDASLWLSQSPRYSDFNYALYLLRRLLMCTRKIQLLDHEMERLKALKHRLSDQWHDVVTMAEDDQKLLKDMKKPARLITESQEAAFWHMWKPMPNHPSVQDKLVTRSGFELHRHIKMNRSELAQVKDEISLVHKARMRPRIHTSTAVSRLIKNCAGYEEFDPFVVPPSQCNPWICGSPLYWTKLSTVQEIPDAHEAKRWAYSLEQMLLDVSGRYHFEQFCYKQTCSENIRFWQACRDLQTIPLGSVKKSVHLIYEEFLSSSAASAVNLSAAVRKEAKEDANPAQRYSFVTAQIQVLELMRKDVYPRFLKSPEYLEYLNNEKPATFGRKFLELFRRPLKSVSEPANIPKTSPLSPGRYSRSNVSVGKRHPMNKDRLHSLSSASSAEILHKVVAGEDDNPFDEDFIDALTMGERRRMDSMVGGTLQRRHSLPGLVSVDEGDEDAFSEGTDDPGAREALDEVKQELDRGEPHISMERKFLRKRSLSLSELPCLVEKDSADKTTTALTMRKLSSSQMDCQTSSPSEVHCSVKTPTSACSRDFCELVTSSPGHKKTTATGEQSMESLRETMNISQSSNTSDAHPPAAS